MYLLYYRPLYFILKIARETGPSLKNNKIRKIWGFLTLIFGWSRSMSVAFPCNFFLLLLGLLYYKARTESKCTQLLKATKNIIKKKKLYVCVIFPLICHYFRYKRKIHFLMPTFLKLCYDLLCPLVDRLFISYSVEKFFFIHVHFQVSEQMVIWRHHVRGIQDVVQNIPFKRVPTAS